MKTTLYIPFLFLILSGCSTTDTINTSPNINKIKIEAMAKKILDESSEKNRYEDEQIVKKLQRELREKGINPNSPDALYYEGKNEYGRGNIVKTIQLLKMAGFKGHTTAQTDLGSIFYEGLGGAKVNYDKALFWFKEAVKSGDDPLAHYNIGQYYNEGLATRKNYKIAVKYYKASAELGYSDAQNNLGYMYHHGLGLYPDSSKARYWYTKAARQGNRKAQENLTLVR